MVDRESINETEIYILKPALLKKKNRGLEGSL